MDSKIGILTRGTSNISVLEALRAAIISGEFPPGSQLKQSEIKNKMGVSQGPVREALGRLVEEGLVEMVPFRGMFVSRLAKRDVEEIYQVRIALEVLAFRLAFEKLRLPEKMQTLEKLYQNAVDAASTLNCEAAVEADLSFHRFLVKESDNARLIKVWDSLLAQARHVLTKLYALDSGENIMSLAVNHEKILQSIDDGNLEEAVKLLQEHLEYARVKLLNKWDDVQ